MNPLHQPGSWQTERLQTKGSQTEDLKTDKLQTNYKPQIRGILRCTLPLYASGGRQPSGRAGKHTGFFAARQVEDSELMPMASSKARRTSGGWPYCHRKPCRRARRIGMVSKSLRVTPSTQRLRSIFGNSTQRATFGL